MTKDCVKNIAKEILSSGSFSVRALEKEYNAIKKVLESKDVTKLSLKDLKSLLAYESFKDGAEIDYVEEILKSKDSKVELLKQLEHFGV
jgi:hypothetical protein